MTAASRAVHGGEDDCRKGIAVEEEDERVTFLGRAKIVGAIREESPNAKILAKIKRTYSRGIDE